MAGSRIAAYSAAEYVRSILCEHIQKDVRTSVIFIGIPSIAFLIDID